MLSISREILGSDIKVDDNFDIIISDGDFAIAEGLECLLSDLRSALKTPPAEMIDFPFEGELMPREIPESSLGIDKIISKFEKIFYSDPRVEKNSVIIAVEKNKANGMTLTASFKTIDGQNVENFIL